MDDAAIGLIKEAVVRALLKSPHDVEFYRAQVDDPLSKPSYRLALQQAIDESRRMLEGLQQSTNQHTA